MSSDPRLEAAIAHWGPRFVANGVVLTDFEEVTASIGSYDQWCGAWSNRAAHHEQLGREPLAKKRLLTAGECLQRAGVYYHFASFLFVHDQAQMKAAHTKQIECRQSVKLAASVFVAVRLHSYSLPVVALQCCHSFLWWSD